MSILVFLAAGSRRLTEIISRGLLRKYGIAS
jgi:hypothetical protein